MPNITTNHAITYTSTPVIVSSFYFFFQFLQYHVIGDSKPLVSFSIKSVVKVLVINCVYKSYILLAQYFIKIGNSLKFQVTLNIDL